MYTDLLNLLRRRNLPLFFLFKNLLLAGGGVGLPFDVSVDSRLNSDSLLSGKEGSDIFAFSS